MLKKLKLLWLTIAGLILSLCLTCGMRLGSSTQSSTIDIGDNLYLPEAQDFRIVVISDLNSQYGSTQYEPEVERAIALIPRWKPDLVLCGGDMIAGQKATLTKLQIQSMWTAFDRHIATPLRQNKIPFAFTIGNHDGSGAVKEQTLVFPQERNLARTYWLDRQGELGLNFVDTANFPFYYSFQNNNLFFLVWDASTHNISEEQLKWVKQALDSTTAQQSKAKIVVGHLPLYPIVAAKNKPGEYLGRAEELRSLLQQNKVQIYISGHHHAYYPGRKDRLRLLHAGALGQGSRQLTDSNLPPYPSITVVDLKFAPLQITYTNYNAKTWEVTELDRLPASIEGEFGSIFLDAP